MILTGHEDLTFTPKESWCLLCDDWRVRGDVLDVLLAIEIHMDREHRL